MFRPSESASLFSQHFDTVPGAAEVRTVQAYAGKENGLTLVLDAHLLDLELEGYQKE